MCDWVGRQMNRTPPETAATMHDRFEAFGTVPLLPRIVAPALLLSGDNNPTASSQQQTFANMLWNGRIDAVPNVGHGVNLLQPGAARILLQSSGEARLSGRRGPRIESSHAPMQIASPQRQCYVDPLFRPVWNHGGATDQRTADLRAVIDAAVALAAASLTADSTRVSTRFARVACLDSGRSRADPAALVYSGAECGRGHAGYAAPLAAHYNGIQWRRVHRSRRRRYRPRTATG